MFHRISNGWQMIKASWRVLMLDKELLIFPLISGTACILVAASFALPLINSGHLERLADDREALNNPWAYAILFAYYFVNYFIIVYFNAAMVACAVIRFDGGDPTLSDGFRAASARLPQILAWSLVSATVGLILKAIESRSERGGRLAAGLVGMAWSAATYFVVPILVLEKVGPIDAVKRSLAVLRKSWGESLVANFGIGALAFVATVFALAPAALGVAAGATFTIAAGVACSLVLIIVIALASSALNAIVLAALYEYATTQRTPPQFDQDNLQHAFMQR